MNVLLDTHAFIWWIADDRRLSKTARREIENQENAVYVSAATAWEMATKVRIGKLANPGGLVGRLGFVIAERGMTELPVSVAHAAAAGSLEGSHRDPFDRMLVAQSRIEGMAVVTNDPVFGEFGVDVIW